MPRLWPAIPRLTFAYRCNTAGFCTCSRDSDSEGLILCRHLAAICSCSGVLILHAPKITGSACHTWLALSVCESEQLSLVLFTVFAGTELARSQMILKSHRKRLCDIELAS